MPDTFGTLNNARVIAGSAAIAGILTLGVTISLAAGTFDISIAANMTFSICLLGALITKLERPVGARGDPDALRRRAGGCGQRPPHLHDRGRGDHRDARHVVGSRRTVVLGLRRPDGASHRLSARPSRIWGRRQIGNVPITVFYLAAVAIALWYLMEHTPVGRYLYAIGSNPRPPSSPASGWDA